MSDVSTGNKKCPHKDKYSYPEGIIAQKMFDDHSKRGA